jgi:hypothetical protein
MIPDSSNIDPAAGSKLEQAWADVWHRWQVIIPRQSIAGRLVRVTVWRRRRGGRWIYKKFVGHSEGGDPKTVA